MFTYHVELAVPFEGTLTTSVSDLDGLESVTSIMRAMLSEATAPSIAANGYRGRSVRFGKRAAAGNVRAIGIDGNQPHSGRLVDYADQALRIAGHPLSSAELVDAMCLLGWETLSTQATSLIRSALNKNRDRFRRIGDRWELVPLGDENSVELPDWESMIASMPPEDDEPPMQSSDLEALNAWDLQEETDW